MKILKKVPLLLGMALMLNALSCRKVPPDEIESELRKENPAWQGQFSTGHFSPEMPVFDFGETQEANAVSLSGKGLADFSALHQWKLKVFCLRESDLSSLNFLRGFSWEKDVMMELRSCPQMTDFSRLKHIPLAMVCFADLPHFSETALLGEKLKSAYLIRTGICKLAFKKPEMLSELLFEGDINATADLSQIAAMTHLSELNLIKVNHVEMLDFSALEYLESISLEKCSMKKLPEFAPRVIRSVWLSECEGLETLQSLSGKVIDRLCIMRCGDPGKLLAKLQNVEINLLVINGAEVSNISFLKRIKNLNCVRFQNCKGLPAEIQEPFVEVIVEDL